MAWNRTVLVDFDGVIHSYTSPFTTADEIKDPPVPGAFEWLAKMVNFKGEKGETFKICIYSSRSKSTRGIQAMTNWFRVHGMPEVVLSELTFPVSKPAAVMTIDDRAWLFQGYFPTPQYIIDFKPWNKK